jgi:hypothetical protein
VKFQFFVQPFRIFDYFGIGLVGRTHNKLGCLFDTLKPAPIRRPACYVGKRPYYIVLKIFFN